MISEIISALRNLPAESGWVVFLCPTPEAACLHSQMLGVLLPAGAKFSGRTALLGDKRISIAAATDDIFLPPGTPYSLGLFGWGQSLVKEASEWQKQASQLLNMDR